MKQWSVFKGLRPYHAPHTLQFGICAFCFQGKADDRIGGQQPTTGEADATIAEVNGPGIVIPATRLLIAAGDFRKSEIMMAGDANGSAPVDGQAVVIAGVDFGTSQHLILAARGKVVRGAVGGNMLLHRQEKPIFNQQAGAV